MEFALVNDVRTKPSPGFVGKCQMCDYDMIAKCGQYVRWHWAHKGRRLCDPWHESETEWHRDCKDMFPEEFQEIVHFDQKTGEKHIADVKIPGGYVVEAQHSPISTEEIRSREIFYQKMIWIVDARDLSGWFTLGMSQDLICCEPMAYSISWSGPSRLLDKWSNSVSTQAVYFDTTTNATIYDERDQLVWFLENPNFLKQKTFYRLLDFDAEERTGSIAPISADVLVDSLLKGRPLPMFKCKETDAHKYQRKMREIGGSIDDQGNKKNIFNNQITSNNGLPNENDIPF